MTNEEMNWAIAIEHGWTCIEDRSAGLMMPAGTFLVGYPPVKALIGKKVALPNYSSDLNAMHEAEKAAFKSSTLWVEFAANLLNVLRASEMSVSDGMVCVLQATAAQRGEAFLRTIGKWRDE